MNFSRDDRACGVKDLLMALLKGEKERLAILGLLVRPTVRTCGTMSLSASVL
jgi:hypothetical protein